MARMKLLSNQFQRLGGRDAYLCDIAKGLLQARFIVMFLSKLAVPDKISLYHGRNFVTQSRRGYDLRIKAGQHKNLCTSAIFSQCLHNH